MKQYERPPKKKGIHFAKNFDQGEDNLQLQEIDLKKYRQNNKAQMNKDVTNIMKSGWGRGGKGTALVPLSGALRSRMHNLYPIDPKRQMKGRSDGLSVKPLEQKNHISWEIARNQRNWTASKAPSSMSAPWDTCYDQFSSQQPSSSLSEWSSSSKDRGEVFHSFSTLASITNAFERDQYLLDMDTHVLERVSEVDEKGYTPAYHAVNSTEGEGALELMKELGNVDLNEPCAYIGANWYKPAFYAAQGNKVALIKALHYNGVDLHSACCRDGGTPAYYATTRGHGETLAVLQDLGVDLSAPCKSTGGIKQSFRVRKLAKLKQQQLEDEEEKGRQRRKKLKKSGRSLGSPTPVNVWGGDDSPVVARIIRSASANAAEAALAAELKIQRLVSGEMDALSKEEKKKSNKAFEGTFGREGSSADAGRKQGRRTGVPKNQQDKAIMVVEDAAAAAAGTVIEMLAAHPEARPTVVTDSGTGGDAAAVAAMSSMYRFLAKQVFTAVVEQGSRLFPDTRAGPGGADKTNTSWGAPPGKSREGERAGELQRQLTGKQEAAIVLDHTGTSSVQKATAAALALAAKHAAARALVAAVEGYRSRKLALDMEERSVFADAEDEGGGSDFDAKKTLQQLDDKDTKMRRRQEEQQNWTDGVDAVADSCAGAAADVVYWLGSLTAETEHYGDAEGDEGGAATGKQTHQSAQERAAVEAKQLMLMATAAKCAGKAAYSAVKHAPLQKLRPRFLSRFDIEGEALAAKKVAERAETEWGLTPACICVLKGNQAVMKLLLKLGVDLSAKATRKHGFTPTDVALRMVAETKSKAARVQSGVSGKQFASSTYGARGSGSALAVYQGMLELLAGLGVQQAVKAIDEQAVFKAKSDRHDWRKGQLMLAQQIKRGGSVAKEAMKRQAAMQSKAQGGKKKQTSLCSNKVYSAGKWFRVTKQEGIAVRENAKLGSLVVHRMSVGEVFMATERRLVGGQVARLRVRQGWTSATSSYDGSALVECCARSARRKPTEFLSPPR
jgi:hypothetical protein